MLKRAGGAAAGIMALGKSDVSSLVGAPPDDESAPPDDPSSLPAVEQPPGELVEARVGGEATVRYLLSHEKANGAFGPAGHDHTDLAWNYPAAHALILLDQELPHPDECFRNGRGAIYKQPGSHRTNFAWDIYQRAQLAAVLGRKGEDGLDLGGSWRLEFRDRQAEPADYYFNISDAQLQSHVAPFCDIPTLAYFVEAITVSGGRIDNPEVVEDFLLPRQVDSGAFVDAYRLEHAAEADAHVMATSQAIMILRSLNKEVPAKAKCINWLKSCQEPAGGFRWNPNNPAASNTSDVWYTWAAVRALAALDSGPANQDGCIEWINTLQNPDGGFADRPHWSSRLYSTYYAIHSLQILTGDALRAISPKTASAWRRVIPQGEYSIFQSHLKSPPGGAEMVEAIREMGLDFIGVKALSPAEREATAAARSYAEEKGYKIEIVACPEKYNHRVRWRGGHPANHVANYLIPPDLTPDQARQLQAADAAGEKGLPWTEYCDQAIAPVVELGSLFYPEMDYEMTNAYMVYDDGLGGGHGYNAVIGGLGWPVWDWIRFFPYRERWVGRLPIVVDGDAHGDIAEWGERLERQRMLYIARTHDLAGFLDACRDGRTVCVIRGGADKSEIAYYGEPAAIEYVKRHQEDWQWW